MKTSCRNRTVAFADRATVWNTLPRVRGQRTDHGAPRDQRGRRSDISILTDDDIIVAVSVDVAPAVKADPQIREQISLDEPNPEGHNPVLSEFLAALREDREPECGAEDNLKSMSMVFGAVLSAKEGRRVQLSEL